jgi:hypothetical protein
MDDPEPTEEEIDARARELARKVMSMPYKPQEWPRKVVRKPVVRPEKPAKDAAKP